MKPPATNSKSRQFSPPTKLLKISGLSHPSGWLFQLSAW
jgi:hypothetical protein